MSERDKVTEHFERCIECYGMPIDTDYSEPLRRETYEQMRADLMLLLGIAMALRARTSPTS